MGKHQVALQRRQLLSCDARLCEQTKARIDSVYDPIFLDNTLDADVAPDVMVGTT